jgi:hypothetical protein
MVTLGYSSNRARVALSMKMFTQHTENCLNLNRRSCNNVCCARTKNEIEH